MSSRTGSILGTLRRALERYRSVLTRRLRIGMQGGRVLESMADMLRIGTLYMNSGYLRIPVSPGRRGVYITMSRGRPLLRQYCTVCRIPLPDPERDYVFGQLDVTYRCQTLPSIFTSLHLVTHQPAPRWSSPRLSEEIWQAVENYVAVVATLLFEVTAHFYNMYGANTLLTMTYTFTTYGAILDTTLRHVAELREVRTDINLNFACRCSKKYTTYIDMDMIANLIHMVETEGRQEVNAPINLAIIRDSRTGEAIQTYMTHVPWHEPEATVSPPSRDKSLLQRTLDEITRAKREVIVIAWLHYLIPQTLTLIYTVTV